MEPVESSKRAPHFTSALREAFLGFARAALTVLAVDYPDPSSLPRVSWRDWDRNERAELVESATTRPDWGLAVALDRRVEALAEQRALLRALAVDPTTARRMSAFIGTPFGARAIRGQDVIRQLIAGIAARVGRFVFEEEAFGEVLAVAEHLLLGSTEPYTVIAPLPLVELDHDVPLGEELVLRQLNDEEVKECLWLGVLRPRSIPFRQVFDFPEGLSGLATSYALPLTVGDNGTEEQRREAMQAVADAEQLVGDGLGALRIAAPGRLETPGIVISEVWRWPEQRGGEVRSSPSHSHLNTWKPPRDLAERGPALLASLRSRAVRGDRRLQATLRRFDFAMTRLRDDDRLIDLFIAAETLFHIDDRPGKGKRIASAANERLSATPLADDAISLEDDYRVRNRVMHDGVAFEDEPAAILESVSRVERVMRACLQVELAARPESGAVVP